MNQVKNVESVGRKYTTEMFKKWDGKEYVPDTAKFWSTVFLTSALIAVILKMSGVSLETAFVLGLLTFSGGLIVNYKLSKNK